MNRIDLGPPRAPQRSLVVIVDPDESFGMLLQLYLEYMGYRVIRLTDARYALRLMRDLKVGLLITTLDGDEIEGLELLVGLAVEATPPPVLLFTRHVGSTPAMAAATRALGVSQVLSRPCHFDVIASAVWGLLGRPAASASDVQTTNRAAGQQTQESAS
jgi:DNA-binding response OmpR family regulator